MKMSELMTDIQTLLARTRAHIEKGTATAGYGAKLETVLKLLNESPSTVVRR